MQEKPLPHNHGRHPHRMDVQRELSHTEGFAAASELFKLLGDPTRMRIFWLLSHCEECVINIAAMMEMSSPAVFHHLRALSQGNLVTGRREGNEVYYKAADTARARLLHQMVEEVMALNCPDRAVDYQASREEVMRRVHDDLTANLSERVTIESLAKKYLMNTTTLKVCFKQVYGESIAAHIHKHRMEAAAVLLRNSAEEVSAVAKAVGYESQSRFTDAFKAAFDELPSEYRKIHR